MTPIKFTHAQLKTAAIVFAEQIFGIVHMPENKSTALIGPGGAMIYVTETVDEASRLVVESTKQQSPKGPKEKK